MITDPMHRVPRFLHVLALVLPLASVACRSADDETAPGDDTLNPDEPGGPVDPVAPSPEEPGAPDTDNPCGISTDYPGDELCLVPPDPSEGIQFHVGPADYDDPVAVEPYLLAPGGEDVVCYNDLAE